MIVKSFPVGLLQCNCTILGCERTREALVIDPGGEPERILEELEELDLKPVKILHTHAHFDHMHGTSALQTARELETFLHAGDTFLVEGYSQQPKLVGLPFDLGPAPRIDSGLEGSQTLRFGEEAALVLHTPGHTPGSCCFTVPLEDRLLLLSGDTLFRDGVGRTDFPGGSYEQLMGSIRDRLLALEDTTRVITGHGPETTIERERRQNPFLQG